MSFSCVGLADAAGRMEFVHAAPGFDELRVGVRGGKH
jgi:hypothetical protein